MVVGGGEGQVGADDGQDMLSCAWGAVLDVVEKFRGAGGLGPPVLTQLQQEKDESQVGNACTMGIAGEDGHSEGGVGWRTESEPG